MQHRLTEIGAEQNSTVVFRTRIAIVTPFLARLETAADARPNGGARPKIGKNAFCDAQAVPEPA